MPEPVQRIPIPAVVATALRGRILSGEIGEGEQLRQEMVARGPLSAAGAEAR